MSTYSIRKCRRILRHGFKIFQHKKERLPLSQQKLFEADLRNLERAVLNEEREEADDLARKVEALIKEHFPKSLFDHLRELVYALAFAIVVAFLIRQFWFELYEVPTGSMRPTVGELDRMVVSKTPFGINVPFIKKPLLFSDDYIKRLGAIVFTVEGMDVADADMLYFNIIPGKKRYIKRCVAKPGDTIYFYGGQIYAINKNDKPILLEADDELLTRFGLEKIDHVPYIGFEGKVKVARPTSFNTFASASFHQMNLPVGKLWLNDKSEIEGSFFNGKEWVADRVDALKAQRDYPMSYSDLWGIGNYAMARLLTKSQVELFYHKVLEEDEGLLYLELRHTPNLTFPKPELRQSEYGFLEPSITPFVSILPLNQSHLQTLQNNLYTARFYIKNGRAYRYHEGSGRPQRQEYDPKFSGVPDGCYEFYYGVGYRVHFGGIRTQLPKDHPLYNQTPELIRKLFNLGLSFNIVFDPIRANQPFNPQRFAYFRHGDLYVMGAPLLKKRDPALIRFVHQETEKQNSSTRERPYIAFVDHGPPMKEDGTLDVEFIKAFGLKVPSDGVVALGDNYAMSADSRDFGFVPTENLRGAPSFTFWPPGPRLGPLPQPPYPWVTLPNFIVWTIALIVILLAIYWVIRRNKRPLFPDSNQKKELDP